jgi:hypothetical protein
MVDTSLAAKSGIILGSIIGATAFAVVCAVVVWKIKQRIEENKRFEVRQQRLREQHNNTLEMQQIQ